MRCDVVAYGYRTGIGTALWAMLVASLVLLMPLPAAGQERITSYDIEVDVAADGSIEITEQITVRAEGDQIRRGIYRDFPTQYRDGAGNRVRVELAVLGVERDGRPEAWFTEALINGVRINTGGDDYLPTLPAEYTFTIRYRTTRQLGFFAAYDELYWNAIGTGWNFPIESGTVTVRLPEPVPEERLTVQGYTGPQGAQDVAYAAAMPSPGTARYRLTQPLQPREGFTIVLTFPKGIIAEPGRVQRATWFLGDNGGVLVALIGLLALLYYTSRTWALVGRDPAPGVIIPRYEPPAGQTPGSLRSLRRMGYDMRCFSADLLALAVAGHVRIHRDKKRSSEKWKIERTAGSVAAPVAATSAAAAGSSEAGATGAQPGASGAPVGAVEAAGGAGAAGLAAPPLPLHRPLLEKLFADGRTELEFDNENAAIVSGARAAHSSAIDKAMQPRYFQRNDGKVGRAFLILVATGLLAFWVSGGAGVPAIIAVLLVMLLVIPVFARLVRAPTPEGRALLDEIEGLKLYLSVAERDELALVKYPDGPPQLDADRYEALLPYAVALDVEDAWTKKFTAAVGIAGVAVATRQMGWYAGSGRASDMGDFTRAIGSSLTSSISSASTPPGSSSGSGGGGSSGGGGGGGGGGGR
jgi:uncharacterized membrane protein YgcG